MDNITTRDRIALAIIRFGFKIASKGKGSDWYGYRFNNEDEYIYKSKEFIKREKLDKLLKTNEVGD